MFEIVLVGAIVAVVAGIGALAAPNVVIPGAFFAALFAGIAHVTDATTAALAFAATAALVVGSAVVTDTPFPKVAP